MSVLNLNGSERVLLPKSYPPFRSPEGGNFEGEEEDAFPGGDMEIYSTYIVHICRSDDSDPPSFTGMVEEVGVQGRNSRTFTSFDELRAILDPGKKNHPLWRKRKASAGEKERPGPCPEFKTETEEPENR